MIEVIIISNFYCYECGKLNDLDAKFCKFCGSNFNDEDKPNATLNDFPNNVDTPTTVPVTISEADGKATAGMVLSIVSIFIPIPILDIIIAIVGIHFGNSAKALPNLSRVGQAQAAVIIGVIGIIFGIFYSLIWLF